MNRMPPWLKRRWSIRTRLLLPLAGLLLLALAGSTLAFIAGTRYAQQQLLLRQAQADVELIDSGLAARADTVVQAAQLLAADPLSSDAASANITTWLASLRARTEQIRTEYGLDLLQLVQADGTVRASSGHAPGRFHPTRSPNPLVLTSGEHALLVSQQPLADGSSVIAAVDLQTEMQRIVLEQRLPINVLLQIPNGATLTLNTASADTNAQARYRHQATMSVAGTPLTITIERSTRLITEVLGAGLQVMIASLLVTALLLLGCGLWIARSISRPVQALAHTTKALANGDLSVRTALSGTAELDALAIWINTATDRLSLALRQQRQELERERAILASIADGVLVCDALGRITVINSAAYQIIGVAEAERLRAAAERGESTHQFYAALEAVQPALNKALGLTEAAPADRITLAGRTFRLHASPIWLDHELLGAVASLQDISAEVESERLRQDFIAVAAHELRTPLTSIAGFIDLFKFTDTAGLTPEQRVFLEVIERNADILNELIRDLLDISRLDHAKAEVAPQPLDLHGCISEVLRVVGATAAAKQLALSSDLAANLPYLNLDPTHMRRIVQNLLSNAIKYTPAGGQVHVACYRRSGDVLIQVQDSGVGIPPEDQPRIFGRFFRAENPLSAEVGGTGLGLAITKSLVELNHGIIFFESAVGVGTTFYVTFPLALACEQVQLPSRQPEALPS